jgi:addiction module RelE/StbE family toxin
MSVTWKLNVHKPAKKLLERMPKNVRKVVTIRLEQLSTENDPAKMAKPLSGNFKGCHRIKVLGNLRIVFQIDETQRTIDVLRIDYRGNVYN